MGAERAASLMGANENSAQTDQKTTATTGPTAQLRIAERPQNRVQRLIDLAFTLLKEAEFLARDKSFSEESLRMQSLNFVEGIDFYQEVERFEVVLIKRALEETAGNQARAAKLLRIKPTTLNSKIKLYNIQF